LSPAFAIKVGETAIRNCFRDQLSAIRKEGVEYMGDRPCIFTEIGIPYDMDDKYAYKTGDFSSQSAAIDANHFALEGSGVNGFTWWVYMTTVSVGILWGVMDMHYSYMLQNNHEWGDLWNGEDLSIFSLEDKPLPLSPRPNDAGQNSVNVSTISVDKDSPAYSESRSSSQAPVSQSNLKSTLSIPSISPQRSNTPSGIDSNPGFRAAEAYVRPSPIATVGDVTSYGFDLRNATFNLSLEAQSATTEDVPTEIFLPEFHFPRDNSEVVVSGGKWTISVDDADGGMTQRLRWWHGVGTQTMTVKGVKRRQGLALGKDDEEGYLEQCQQTRCTLM